MIFDFWKKQTEFETKKRLIKKLIEEVEIPENDKKLFLWAIEIVPEENIENLYNDLVHFIEEMELKEIDEIEKNNFISIDWMTIKEAHTKKREINSFNFLLNNL